MTPHERDRSLEQWLSASSPDTGAPTDSCLDAETVAAWLDDGLAPFARQQAEAHVSTCARCQALVSSVVTLETTDAAVAGPVPSRWRAWLNWMVPLGAVATAALALAVWLNVPARPVPRVDEARQARRESAPDAASAPQSANAPAEPAPAPRAALPRQPRPSPDGARKATAESESVAGRANGRLASAPPASAGASAKRAASADEAAANAAANVLAPDAPAPVSAAQDAVSVQAFAARETPGFDVMSPDPQVRWRLSGRVALRSTDRGATWTPVVADVAGRLLAGSAPSAAVCWLVGERGLVLRSVDGVTFGRLTAPDTVDLTAVMATSAANAAVNAADGRRFATSNGGTTWELMR